MFAWSKTAVLASLAVALTVTAAEARMKTTPGGKDLRCGADGCTGGPGGQTPSKLWRDIGKVAAAPVRAYKPVYIFSVDGKRFCHYPPSVVPAPCP